jgi:hypothetical protein
MWRSKRFDLEYKSIYKLSFVFITLHYTFHYSVFTKRPTNFFPFNEAPLMM